MRVMEIHKKDKLIIYQYHFSFIKCQNTSFCSTKKAKEYKYITLHCSLEWHGDCSAKLFSNRKYCLAALLSAAAV